MTKFFGFLIAGMVVVRGAGAQTLPYLDTNFGCLDGAKVDRYIADLHINIASFGGRELCNPTSDGKKIASDIYLIEAGRFGAGGTNVFLHNWVDGNNYYGWMKSQTRGMKRANDIPYASAYNSFGTFTFQDGWSQSSTLGRVGTIIHEARHTVGYQHVVCTTGPYANSRTLGCDNSIAEGGAHAIEMEYYARVSLEGQNFHPVYQAMARLMALGRSNVFFNQSPIQTRQALVLQRNDQSVMLYDKSQLLARPAPTGDGLVLKRTSFGATLLKNMNPLALDLYGVGQGNAEISDAYSYFKMLVRSDSVPLNFSDMEEYDSSGQRYLVALTRGGQLYSFDFPGGQWGSPIDVSRLAPQKLVTTAPDGSEGLFVLGRDGSLNPFDAKKRRMNVALAQHWNDSYSAYVNYGGKLLRLGRDGTLDAAADGQEAIPVAHGMSFDQVVRAPMYDAFDVVPSARAVSAAN